jgi:hypothetical protein
MLCNHAGEEDSKSLSGNQERRGVMKRKITPLKKASCQRSFGRRVLKNWVIRFMNNPQAT